MSIRIKQWTKNNTTGWEIDIRLTTATGERIRERLKSPVSSHSGSLAFAREREKLLLLEGGKKQGPEAIAPAVPTLAEFQHQFLSYSATNNKASTHSAKQSMLRTHLVPAFGNDPLDCISLAKVEGYKAAQVAAGLSKKSINNHLAALMKLLHLAVEWGVLAHAPRVKLFRLDKQTFEFLSFDETPRFMAAVPTEWKTFATVALKTGGRVGELLAMKWEDVDLTRGQWVVRRTLWNGQEDSPKGGRDRCIPLSNEAVVALKSHRHLKGAYVFCDAAGARLSHGMVKDVVPRACSKAGLAKRLTMHDLRHTFASHLVMRGVTLKAVQELLGHTTMEMTLRYAHLSPEVKRDAVQLLDAPVSRGDVGETGV